MRLRNEIKDSSFFRGLEKNIPVKFKLSFTTFPLISFTDENQRRKVLKAVAE